MSSSSFKTPGLTALKMLVMMSFLAGCSPTMGTLTGGIDASREGDAVIRALTGTERPAVATDRELAAAVCRVWVPTTYSSRDTEETRTGNRANNAARDAYCG